MQLMKRRFLRLNEISEKTQLTQGDFLDAVSEGRLKLCAYFEGERLGALQRVEEQWTVSAVFNYQGIVRLFPDDAKTLATMFAAHKVTQVGILEPKNISLWQAVPDVFDNIKKTNVRFTDRCSVMPDAPIAAYAGLHTLPTMENTFGSIYPHLPDEIKSRFDNLNGVNFSESMSKAHRLYKSQVTINPEQLRADINDIVSVFGDSVLKGLTQPEVADDKPSIQPEALLSHPIEKVACRILKSNIELNAREVWETMREDARQELTRTFDIDHEIIEINRENLVWQDKGSRESELSYSAFRKKNLLKVRKHLNQCAS
ncbi:hypothetical protein ACPV54_13050 [Vibrio mediterranei]